MAGAALPLIVIIVAGMVCSYGERAWLTEEQEPAVIAFTGALGLLVVALYAAAFVVMT
jgi:hypothetical protein